MCLRRSMESLQGGKGSIKVVWESGLTFRATNHCREAGNPKNPASCLGKGGLTLEESLGTYIMDGCRVKMLQPNVRIPTAMRWSEHPKVSNGLHQSPDAHGNSRLQLAKTQDEESFQSSNCCLVAGHGVTSQNSTYALYDRSWIIWPIHLRWQFLGHPQHLQTELTRRKASNVACYHAFRKAVAMCELWQGMSQCTINLPTTSASKIHAGARSAETRPSCWVDLIWH